LAECTSNETNVGVPVKLQVKNFCGGRLSGGAKKLGKELMKSNRIRRRVFMRISGFFFAGIFACGAMAGAQEKAQTVPQRGNAYDVARESVLQGTVVSYTASSTTPPLGAHVKLQTSSGMVDVHLGNAKLLSINHLTLEAGDAVRITGENVAFGQSTFYAARLIQKGSQTVAVRSTHGTPLVNISQLTAEQKEGVR
jgi:hypothetical protein